MNGPISLQYERDGFVPCVRVVDAPTAARHRQRLEDAERQVGPMHYRDKAHTVLRTAWELATSSTLLDAVEACIGPDILVYNTSYIVKEPQSPARVNWHQDLTYWGLSDDDAQVSAWIALAPATVESGCMRMIPGSHRGGKVAHVAPAERRDDDVLQLGQFIAHVDDDTSVYIPLEPGEASLHHGWTVHASSPNVSTDRRIGLNVQFLAPHCRQVMHDGDTALLVRGEDRFHHFGVDTLATVEVDLSALERQRAHEQRIKSTYSVVRDQR